MPRHTTAATGAKNGARWSTICTATSQESPAASAACTIGTAEFRHRVSRRASSSPRRDRISSMAPTAFLTGRTADAGDATVDGALESITIERDLGPCQRATQRAGDSARDRGHDVVERRRHRQPFLGAVILAKGSLDTVDDEVPAPR